jgi:hypothetical protein
MGQGWKEKAIVNESGESLIDMDSESGMKLIIVFFMMLF